MLFKLYIIALFSFVYVNAYAQNNTLSIIEDEVNIRQSPSTDAQVQAKVNTGKQCTVSNQSKFFETIGTNTDFWYEVSVDGKKGWVFGAQTSKKLSTNPQTSVLVYKRAERDASLHILFEAAQLEEQGWKGHGTRVWDFGYGDAQNNYSGLKFYTGGNKMGDLSVKGMKEKSFTVQWKVAPQTDPKDRLSTDKEVPVIVSIQKLKTPKNAKAPKEPKPAKEPEKTNTGRF